MKNRETPEDIKTRIPLFKNEWFELYNKMGGHPHSPVWNTKCGDRLTEEDTSFIREFSEEIKANRESFRQTPPDRIILWAESFTEKTLWFRKKIKSGNIKESWESITPMTRGDMQRSLELIVPEDADLTRLIVNPTSGTTGHPISAPSHPRAVGCYDPMIQYTLERHGVKINFESTQTAAIQICAQKKTITYHTVHSFLNGAGFAKINLSPENWKSPESAGIYISEMKPVFLSGDPFSFIEYIRLKISYKPKAVLTTALHLESALRKEFENYFQCPVIDMYSLNETGPVAYSCPENPSKFHILPHDLFVEIASAEGKQMPEGTVGNIALTGGRNPYLPLLRYITGDTASIDYNECSCGEKTPALKGLQGRPMVLFRTPSGIIINSIDIAGIIREYPIYFFKFTQKKDFCCNLSISAGSDFTFGKESDLKNRLSLLFGNELEICIDRDLQIGEEKNIPFVSELNLFA